MLNRLIVFLLKICLSISILILIFSIKIHILSIFSFPMLQQINTSIMDYQVDENLIKEDQLFKDITYQDYFFYKDKMVYVDEDEILSLLNENIDEKKSEILESFVSKLNELFLFLKEKSLFVFSLFTNVFFLLFFLITFFNGFKFDELLKNICSEICIISLITIIFSLFFLYLTDDIIRSYLDSTFNIESEKNQSIQEKIVFDLMQEIKEIIKFYLINILKIFLIIDLIKISILAPMIFILANKKNK